MTITTTTSRWEAVGNGSTTVFPYNNKIFADTDLKVYLDGVLQTLTTHYTVSGAGANGGGNVTFLTAPANGVAVLVVRDVPDTQLIDYPAAGAFPSIATEDGLDKRTIISQQQKALFQRSLRYLETDSNVPSAELPTLSTLKGKYLRFDATTGAPTAVAVAASAVPAALKTPYDYGATPGNEMSEDNSPYVQALMNAWTASWSTTAQAFTVVPYFAGVTFRCDSEIFLNETRQPGGVILGGGGGIYSKAANGVALNALKTNVLTIKDLQIYGDKTTPPDVGILYGRTDDGAIAPGVRLINFVTRGYFNKAAGINLASEVGSLTNCYFNNQSPVRSAQAFFWAQSTASINAHLTGGSATIQASLDIAGNSTANPTVGSFLGHAVVGCDFKRASAIVAGISAISKANPAVVTLTAAVPATWVNGTQISLHNVLGMTELRKGIYTIANISGNTFELAGVDSTGYGTFTSGNAWQATGPAFTIAGAQQMNMISCYPLAYNEVNHIIDFKNANAPRKLDLSFQAEANTDYMCELLLPDDPNTAIVQGGFSWNNLSASQRVGEDVFKVTGTGRLRIDGAFIHVGAAAAETGAKLFSDPSNVVLYDAEIHVPLSALLNAADEYEVYDAVEVAYDRQPRTNTYKASVDYSQPIFRVAGGLQTVATFESIDTSASTADNVSPLVDLYRNNEGALSSAAVGSIRFSANNDATETTLTVTNITQANPAVVTVDSAALIAAGWTNGYVVVFGNLDGGMNGLREGGYTIANINTGAGTFELSGVDSTGYTAFVSGNVRNAIKRVVAGVAGFVENDTAYAEEGRLLLQASVNGVLTTVGHLNADGMFLLGNRVHSNIIVDAAGLASVSDAINTTGKYIGKQVWDVTNAKPVWAAGANAAGVWVNADGTTAHAPV